MSRKILHFVLLAALVAASSLALADPPVLVGRISTAEGRVTVQTDDGEETGSLVNWPVKAGDRITTAAGARTEFRVGPVAVRLDGDSALDIEALDEDVMHLRLDYGTANVRVRDPQALAGFELSTPQGRVLLTEPGSVRVDADREPDTMTVNVLQGAARVEAAGTALTLRTGKRADIRGDDVRTGVASRDSFDAWTLSRDRRDETSVATRYIPSYVTGYEELDNYGSWTVNDDYGPLWVPRAVPVDWAPYRDGRWAWVAPWGWTWVDNAQWGYAPFHYGRWVVVNRRWCWAPGRIVGRPVWSPALVGWVGGSGWEVSFSDRRHAPGFGWYPLTPRDRYVPHYAVSPDYARRLEWQYRHPLKPVQVQREGVTIVPRDQFEAHRVVRVNNLPRASVVPRGGALPVVTAPVVPNGVRITDRNRDGVPDRQPIGRSRDVIETDRNRDGIADRLQVDRNRDGVPDRQPIGRSRDVIETDRNHDGVPDRQQIDRNRDGIADRQQADRNHDGTPDRLQIDRNRDGVPDRSQWRERNVIGTDRPAAERPRVSIVGAPAAPVAPAPAPQPVLRAAPQPAPSPMPQAAPAPQPQPQLQPAPSRAFIANERLERQREMNEERAERRREFEGRRQAIEAQQAPRPAPQPAPAPAPAPAPVVQPRPAPQEREARPQQGGHERTRGDRGENGRER